MLFEQTVHKHYLYIRRNRDLQHPGNYFIRKIKLGPFLLIQIPPTTFWGKIICRTYLETLLGMHKVQY